ncbi:MAG TPA: hypothetical protein DIS62_06365 [Candidatus Kerfeldbacteria bacterium]|nr:MAG: hypothetical protein UY34_C0001G0085 [Parcubacteria group bacterium GW2011_GWA2_48_9]KKW16601.1 MAG: hypothetical protein UY52_C0002G0015 [Parcubacteria group bacterium GW2011_GWC2_49_9]HCJ52467.1 hypothetical protein [Candidatus Kerfeldbacteria bacterium]HCM68585.1 hypothetical protein [Candidatus Kerfeldbacteria bacterium]
MEVVTYLGFGILFYLCIRVASSGYYLFRIWGVSRLTHRGTIVMGDLSNSQMKILVHGDSVAAGVGAYTPEQTIAGLLAQHFSTTHYVTVVNKGKPGVRMIDLANQGAPDERYDLVVLIVSSNDVYKFTPLRRFALATREVLDAYSAVAKQVVIAGPAKMSELPALIGGHRMIMRFREHRYATILAETCEKYSNVTHIIPYAPPGMHIFAPDKYHPNPEGHRLWFELILKSLSSF